MNFIRDKAKERKRFLDSINYLTEEDVKNQVPTIEKLKRMSPLLHEYNPMTYAILLNHHNIPHYDRDYYQEVLQRLLQREKVIVEETLKLFNTQNVEVKDVNINITNGSGVALGNDCVVYDV